MWELRSRKESWWAVLASKAKSRIWLRIIKLQTSCPETQSRVSSCLRTTNVTQIVPAAFRHPTCRNLREPEREFRWRRKICKMSSTRRGMTSRARASKLTATKMPGNHAKDTPLCVIHMISLQMITFPRGRTKTKRASASRAQTTIWAPPSVPWYSLTAWSRSDRTTVHLTRGSATLRWWRCHTTTSSQSQAPLFSKKCLAIQEPKCPKPLQLPTNLTCVNSNLLTPIHCRCPKTSFRTWCRN